MAHVQLRLEQHAAVPPLKAEPSVLSASLLLAWPTTATEEEIQQLLETLCVSAMDCYRMKLTERVPVVQAT